MKAIDKKLKLKQTHPRDQREALANFSRIFKMRALFRKEQQNISDGFSSKLISNFDKMDTLSISYC